MNNQQKMQLVLLVFNTIFQSKAANTDISQIQIQSPFLIGGVARGRWFKNSATGQQTLRGFDLNINLGNRIINIRILEQNPNKSSQYAIMAQRGSKIAWVIDQKVQNGFLGRIQDGQWYPALERATQPYTPNTATIHATEINDLPDIPNSTGIPEFVLHHFANNEDPNAF